MKNNAIDENIGHFDMTGLSGLEGMKIDNITPQMDTSGLPDGDGVIVLASVQTSHIGFAPLVISSV